MAVRSVPVTKVFEVKDKDDNVDWTIEYAQISEGDYIALVDLASNRETTIEGGYVSGIRTEYNKRRILRHGCYRAMKSCSLKWEDSGDPVFTEKDGWVKKAMTEADFNKAWDALPPEYADNIIGYFYQANPTLAGEF